MPNEYFTEHDVLLTMAKQASVGVVPPSPASIVIPIAKGAQGPEHKRNKIENDARFRDGYKRPFALGNHNSGADMPMVSNLDIFGYPLAGLCGGLTDGTTTGGITPHTGKPTKTVFYYTLEESYEGMSPAVFYQYVDQVYTELVIDYDQEGLFKPTFKTVGTGLLIPSATSMDSTPSEISGAPAEMANWSTLTDGVDEANVQKCQLNVKREAIVVRAGNGGVGRAIRIGEITVTGTVTIIFKSDALYAKARGGVPLSFDLGIERGTKSFNALMPETLLEPSGPKKQSGNVIVQEFAFEANVDTDANSPIFFTLNNGIAAHNTIA